jgi:hypothetical protein
VVPDWENALRGAGRSRQIRIDPLNSDSAGFRCSRAMALIKLNSGKSRALLSRRTGNLRAPDSASACTGDPQLCDPTWGGLLTANPQHCGITAPDIFAGFSQNGYQALPGEALICGCVFARASVSLLLRASTSTCKFPVVLDEWRPLG